MNENNNQEAKEMLTQGLREIRESLGLSPEEFSRLVGCSFMSVYNWENGSKPSPYFRREIQKVIKRHKRD